MASDSMSQEVTILGTGPAGLTAAIYLARAEKKPLVIEGPEPGGQLTYTTEIENYPGVVEDISADKLLANMRQQAQKFGAKFKRGIVKQADFSKNVFELVLESGDLIKTKTVILATGASARWLEIPGEAKYIGQGISSCATCDGFFYKDRSVIVIGGGDSAMEEALFLTKHVSSVKLVHRRLELRASKIMQDRVKANKKVLWHLNRKPLAIKKKGDKLQLLVEVKDDQREEFIEADGIFVAIGHTPNTAFLNGQLKLDANGYIEVERGTAKTNRAGVFACGDVQDSSYRQAITAAGSGCMAALDCERYLMEI
ncbi:MAG: hypothetical protein RLZ12_717 [Bacillota bacterium]